MRQTWLWLGCLLTLGCMMQNLSPAEKLKEAVLDLNEQARWQRLDLALEQVHPAYQTQFRISHADWALKIEISEVELVGLKRDIDKEESAQAIILYNWYDRTTMTAHATTVEQIWAKVSRSYLLRNENIVAGDPGLLNLSITGQLTPTQTVQPAASPND